jgi:hypothetical protein
MPEGRERCLVEWGIAHGFFRGYAEAPRESPCHAKRWRLRRRQTMAYHNGIIGAVECLAAVGSAPPLEGLMGLTHVTRPYTPRG